MAGEHWNADPNFYAGGGLDRADHLRVDRSWLDDKLRHASTRFVAVWRSRNLVVGPTVHDAACLNSRPRPLWLGHADVAPLLDRASEVTFLGLCEENAYFALDVSRIEAPEREPSIADEGRFRDLREVGPLLERFDGAILAYARGLMHWHRRHRFCGVCGSATESAQGGHVRKCTNPDCGASHFPRTDPAVIMLIHDGGDRCVLGRQQIWPPGMHSTLAGFVEPGESLEDSVAREVKEEVGLDVTEITYHSSQPWPFPSSLMLGFHARCEDQPLRVNTEELDSAAWFTRDDLLNSPEDEGFKLPRKDSIARRLIRAWLGDDEA